MAAAFKLYTAKEIKPNGWLERQLKIQAAGLAGNLDRVWPDVRDSKWIGGDREGWERVPYWLDGFIPLAYLLCDDDMKSRALRYIEKILENQKEDGWICPNGDTPRDKYDLWALILISKVLTVYYESSGDERIPPVLFRMMKNLNELLSEGEVKLFNWGKYRWFEAFIALRLLSEKYPGEEWIFTLAKLLRKQGTDYAKQKELWMRPINKWTYDTHIVNIAMMLKYEAVSCDILGEKYSGKADELYEVLYRYNSTPTGTFTGDECLSGLSPIQGTELCAVVELMYSYELLYAYTGDSRWARRLEFAAFNALPAAISDDMWAHQYDQLSNQIDTSPLPGRAIFRTNGRESHIFGLEPNYGCCTANFGQGWPKLVLSAFMRSDDAVIGAVAVPCILSDVWEGVPYRVTLSTDYPFKNDFEYRIWCEKDSSLKLKIRIPSYAENIKVNGLPAKGLSKTESGDIWLEFKDFYAGERVIKLSYDTTPHLVARPFGLSSLVMGPLVFSLPIKYKTEVVEYTKNDVERRYPYCDYHYLCDSDWNFAFASGRFEVERRDVGDIPFSSTNPPVVIKTQIVPIDWGLEEGFDTICAKTPKSLTPTGSVRTTEFYPYGCAKLRMTELPLVYSGEDI